jgi:hypothetical protein
MRLGISRLNNTHFHLLHDRASQLVFGLLDKECQVFAGIVLLRKNKLNSIDVSLAVREFDLEHLVYHEYKRILIP